MKIDLSKYSGKRICVAVSGGKDSMALLHYLHAHGAEYSIKLSALNCDHCIRGEESERDSAFVKAYCGGNCIPLRFFKAEGQTFSGENAARKWRFERYLQVIEEGFADMVATAHHMNDNAETVLFNLARGSALDGMSGISDLSAQNIIRPLIACTREEIDGYIAENAVPYVVDGSNFTLDYTRNKIRLNVLPALEDAVNGAVENIFRFSRLAAEDEEYFLRKADEIIVKRACGYLIKPCGERVIFRRAARKITAVYLGKKDFTSSHFNSLYSLQFSENGKKFSFLGLTAFKEKEGVAIVADCSKDCSEGTPFWQNINDGKNFEYCGRVACAEENDAELKVLVRLQKIYGEDLKTLKFDLDAIPASAVIRFRRAGDKFKKFGGGSKSLSDYLTDKKVPQSLRDRLPLVCDGSNVLIVGGVEISDYVKISEKTKNAGVFICENPFI